MRFDSLLPAVYAPLRSLADVEALERVPLEERIGSWDFAASLLVGCRRDPEKPALHYVENGDSAAPALTWSYGELERHATQIANLLRSRGIRAGDAVAVVTPTLPALYASVLGAFLAGRPFPVNWMLLADPLRELLVHADVKAVIALGPTPGYAIWDNIEAACRARPDIAVFSIAGPGGRALPESDVLVAAESHPRDRLAFERAPAQAGDVAAYVHSGGTTGAPKIVKLTHGGLVYRQWATNVGLAFRADEVLLADTPMFHIGGFCVRGLVPVANGTTIVIPTPLGARDKTYLTHYWRFVERFRITQLSGVPTTLSVLAKQPPQGEDISSLRPCFSTGSTAIAPSVQRAIADASGARPLMMYGLTENTSNATIDPRDGPVKAGCSGIRVPYTTIRIVAMDDDGGVASECAIGETGMVVVAGPGVAAGYVDPTQDRGSFMADGSFVTGDLGSVDADGYLRIVGRRKDLIIRGGHNIDPSQIEHALMQAPAVALAAAVGKPDPHAGELPIAYVQLHEGAVATAAELLAFASPRILERAAIPKEIIIVDRIPLSAVGKPLKYQLAADAASRALHAALRDVPGSWTLDVEPCRGGGMRAVVRVGDTTPATRTAIERIMATFTTPFVVIDAAAEGPAVAAGMAR